MAYFNFFPTIEYTFNNEKTLEMVDIFRKVSFTQNTLNNESIFDSYYLSDGGSPEKTSFDLYGSSEFSWMLFASNRFVNPHKEWAREYTSLISELNSKYNGKTIYISRIPNLLPGDVIFKITRAGCSGNTSQEIYTGCNFSFENPIQTYKIIKEWNQEFRYLICVGGSSSYEFAVGDTFAVLRKNSAGEYKPVLFGDGIADTSPGTDGFVDITINSETFSIFRIAKIEEEKNTIVKFLKNSIVVSPYRKVSTMASSSSTLTNYYANTSSNITTYPSGVPSTSATDFGGTVLDSYMRNVLSTEVTYKTKMQIEIEKNEKAYSIKALKPKYLSSVIGMFTETINTNQGRVLSLELNI
jgi:hypothetical protein